jgi:hypothetical protein
MEAYWFRRKETISAIENVYTARYNGQAKTIQSRCQKNLLHEDSRTQQRKQESTPTNTGTTRTNTVAKPGLLHCERKIPMTVRMLASPSRTSAYCTGLQLQYK